MDTNREVYFEHLIADAINDEQNLFNLFFGILTALDQLNENNNFKQSELKKITENFSSLEERLKKIEIKFNQ